MVIFQVDGDTCEFWNFLGTTELLQLNMSQMRRPLTVLHPPAISCS